MSLELGLVLGHEALHAEALAEVDDDLGVAVRGLADLHHGAFGLPHRMEDHLADRVAVGLLVHLGGRGALRGLGRLGLRLLVLLRLFALLGLLALLGLRRRLLLVGVALGLLRFGLRLDRFLLLALGAVLL